MRDSVPAVVHDASVLQPSDAVPVASATLPAEPLTLIGVVSVVWSGPGSGAPVGPLASCTRKYRPGWIVPDSSVSWPALLPKLPVPVALAYWSDMPSRTIGSLPRL